MMKLLPGSPDLVPLDAVAAEDDLLDGVPGEERGRHQRGQVQGDSVTERPGIRNSVT